MKIPKDFKAPYVGRIIDKKTARSMVDNSIRISYWQKMMEERLKSKVGNNIRISCWHPPLVPGLKSRIKTLEAFIAKHPDDIEARAKLYLCKSMIKQH